MKSVPGSASKRALPILRNHADTECLNYKLVRSRRRTISLTIHEDGSLEIRSPLRCSKMQIERFIADKAGWINRKRLESQDHIAVDILPVHQWPEAARQINLMMDQILNQRAVRKPVKIAVRDQRSRWGSCSSRGHIAINVRLVNLPEHLQEYIILHELCHLQHLNHGPDFWKLLESHLPDAHQRRKALRKYRLVQEEKK